MLSNLPSERLVLGGLFQHGIEAFTDVNSIVEERTFSNPRNQQVYLCLKTCFEDVSQVDIPSFYSAAAKLGLDKSMSDPKYIEYIDSVRNTNVNINNVYTHAKIIRRLQYGRELQACLKDAHTRVESITGEETLSEIQSLAEAPIQTLSLQYQNKSENRPEAIGSDIREAIQNLKENPNTLRGISTGFPVYDMMLGGGLRRQCVDVIAARKKEGKSILGMNIAYNVASRGIPVLILDTEMNKEEQQHRLLSKLAKVNINEISQAIFVGDESKEKRVDEAGDLIADLNITYCKCNGRKFGDILAEIRRWLLQTVKYDSSGRLNDCLVVYDYFKITNVAEIGGDMKEYQLLGYQMSALKDFCSEYDFPLLTFVQTNRDGVSTEDSTIVARSDAIMDTATSLTIYKTKTQEEIAEDGGIRNGNKKLVGILYRHGPGLDNDYVNLLFNGEFSTITELGTRNNMAKKQFETKIEKSEF